MFKKLLYILLLPTSFILGQDITGTGSAVDPYMIYNGADFDSIRYYPNSGKYFKLANDIDLSSFSDWVPIGNDAALWTNYLDGNNHRITGLHITSFHYNAVNDNYTAGLFDNVQAAADYAKSIERLEVYKPKVSINEAAVSGKYYSFGTIAAINGTYRIGENIDTCLVTLADININLTGDTPAANCTFGGVIGKSNNPVSQLFSSGRMIINEVGNVNWFVGGILGYATYSAGRVTQSFSNMDIIAGTTANDSYGAYVGGVVGLNYYVVEDCYYRGHQLESNKFVGGVIGQNNVTCNRSYSVVDTIGGTDRTSGTFLGTAIGMLANYTGYPAYSQGAIFYVYADTEAVGIDTSLTSADKSYGNTVGSYAGGYPVAKTTTEMKDWNTYSGDFDPQKWAIDSNINDGYPYLIWYPQPDPPSIEITTPGASASYIAGVGVTIEAHCLMIDSVTILYKNSLASSWDTLATVAVVDSNISYPWSMAGVTQGTYSIKVEEAGYSYVYDTSPTFTIIGVKTVEILYPKELVTTKSVGDTVHIVVATILVDSLNLFYSVGDSLNWVTIVTNLPVTDNTIDTTTYIWNLPNFNGTIWLKASSVADTAIYVFNQPGVHLGTNIRSYPDICWYNDYYFATPLNFPGYSQSVFNYAWLVDQSCGWAYNSTYRVTQIITPSGNSIQWLEDTSRDLPFEGNPLLPTGTYLYDLVDTTYWDLGELYAYGDTVTYKLREYFYDQVSGDLLCKDLVNDIDSIFVGHVSTLSNNWSGVSTILQVYNIEWDKISGDTISSAVDLESLNNTTFKPLILLSSTGSTYRGRDIVAVQALDYPNDQESAYDVEKMYTALTMTRNYFRGIDPKARKKGR